MPVAGETAMFERLSLEGFQAGLSWLTILNKRERFREVFHGFDAEACAALTDDDVERLMQDVGIVRNRAKILATRKNGAAVVRLREEGGLEAFVRLVPAGARRRRRARPPRCRRCPTSRRRCRRRFSKRGFGFVGPTTMHALMEAVGIVDTHLVGCHRRGASGEWPS